MFFLELKKFNKKLDFANTLKKHPRKYKLTTVFSKNIIKIKFKSCNTVSNLDKKRLSINRKYLKTTNFFL